MVEERDAGVEALFPGAIQVDGNTDLGFIRVAANFGGALGLHDGDLGFYVTVTLLRWLCFA
jgi:hypothetical protein